MARVAKKLSEEQEYLVQSFAAFSKLKIAALLREHQVSIDGTKPDLISRLRESLLNEVIEPDDLVRILDQLAPWGKQHVYLMNGPASIPPPWGRSEQAVRQHLRRYGVDSYLGAEVPLILPEALELSSISYTPQRLRVTAIQRRDYRTREPSLDETKTTRLGEHIELRAFVHNVRRATVILDWDIVGNAATLQISELTADDEYDDVYTQFASLTASWLQLNAFPTVTLRDAIRRIHEAEEQGSGEFRSHGIEYQTLQGRRLQGRSSIASVSVLGEAVIDNALSAVRQSGLGHKGNFYWLLNGTTPLERELHVILLGEKSRISFKTPSDEQTVLHVLSRIRSLC